MLLNMFKEETDVLFLESDVINIMQPYVHFKLSSLTFSQ